MRRLARGSFRSASGHEKSRRRERLGRTVKESSRDGRGERAREPKVRLLCGQSSEEKIPTGRGWLSHSHSQNWSRRTLVGPTPRTPREMREVREYRHS